MVCDTEQEREGHTYAMLFTSNIIISICSLYAIYQPSNRHLLVHSGGLSNTTSHWKL